MKYDNRIILILVCCLTLFLFPVAAFSEGPLRIALGLICLLFFPGYALISALFPRQGTLSLLERAVLGIGLSIAIVPLIGLGLNYTPWGIRLNPILIAVASFIFAAALAGIIRQQLMPAEQRFAITFNWSWDAIPGAKRASKILVMLGCLAVLALAGLGIYQLVTLPPVQQPTEFYILNAEGRAQDYPRQVKAGDPVNVTVTVINHEAATADYLVRITCAGVAVKEAPAGRLAPGQKWAGQVSFVLQTVGLNQKVDFQLYKDGAAEPYFKDPLYLYLDVAD